MEGVIKLLPDLVANQIAAGEVIQRPASVVKELMENAVDAGATMVELWVNDAGKKLITVVDNGSGMSPADSRLCFERHATSKITRSDDLFNIRTLGFRGEALASIAAISQLEMKTKRKEDEMATHIRIEGGKITFQEPCAHQNGTTIAVKNLFYNVPARRNFLKSNNVEMNHVSEEFNRVALANPNVAFKLFNDNKEHYHLPPANLKQRIVNLYGGQYNSRVVPVEQDSDIAKISGFIGKPEFAKKKRGEQYFFVNGRFFKNSYLHHSVMKAYSELIAESNIPSYFLFFEVDPAQVDVNIHPTKTEVNFIEGPAIYSILNTAVRNSLGKHNLTPMIEFEPENGFTFHFSKDREIRPPEIRINPDYNPFDQQPGTDSRVRGPGDSGRQTTLLSQRGWEKLYEGFPDEQKPTKGGADAHGAQTDNEDTETGGVATGSKLFQMHNAFVVTSIKSGLLVINQQYAHQRILYERFLNDLKKGENGSQQLLIPIEMTVTNEEMRTLDEMSGQLMNMGFQFTTVADGTISFQALPASMPQDGLEGLIHSMIDDWNEEKPSDTDDVRNARIARSMACRLSIKTGTTLSQQEMQALTDQLFSAQQPQTAPSGHQVYIVIPVKELEERFQQKR